MRTVTIPIRILAVVAAARARAIGIEISFGLWRMVFLARGSINLNGIEMVRACFDAQFVLFVQCRLDCELRLQC